MKKNKLEEEMINVIENHVQIKATVSLMDIYNKIVGAAYAAKISAIRVALSKNDREVASVIKNTLTAVTISGTFNGTRASNKLLNYSGFIVLDMDHLSASDLFQAKCIAKTLPETVMYFVSPSGDGLKIIVAVDSDASNHKAAYEQVITHYNAELGLPFDDKTKDIARLCYMSHDPEAYLNSDYKVFHVNLNQSNTINNMQTSNNNCNDQLNTVEIFNKAEEYTSRKGEFTKGQRNNYIFRLACICNRYGMDKNYVTDIAIEKYQEPGFDSTEIFTVINGVFEKYKDNFKTWNISAYATQKKSDIASFADNNTSIKQGYNETPLIPACVYDNLPDVLTSIPEQLENEREKDVCLTSILTLLSGCFPTVNGSYHKHVMHANLFTLVTAPPASGKGILNNCRNIIYPCHDALLQEGEANKKAYYRAFAAYEAGKAKGEICVRPEKPKYPKLYLPGNSSAYTIYKHLLDCNGEGIICETETDSLGYIIKNDRDAYSTIFRNAFHHEPVSLCRKNHDEVIEIETPKLSVLLSGTPAQAKMLIPSAEDGLFSRFLFYSFTYNNTWSDVSPDNSSNNIQDIQQQVSDELINIINHCRKYQINFTLATDQWQQLNSIFSEQLKTLCCFVGEEFSANVKRMGLIAFRIAMIFTIIEQYSQVQDDVTLTCSDNCFNAAIELSKIYLQHAVVMFTFLPNEQPVLGGNLQRLFDALPNKFERKAALQVAGSIGIKTSDRTIDSYLKRLSEHGYLTKQYNDYEKRTFSLTDVQESIAA